MNSSQNGTIALCPNSPDIYLCASPKQIASTIQSSVIWATNTLINGQKTVAASVQDVIKPLSNIDISIPLFSIAHIPVFFKLKISNLKVSNPTYVAIHDDSTQKVYGGMLFKGSFTASGTFSFDATTKGTLKSALSALNIYDNVKSVIPLLYSLLSTKPTIPNTQIAIQPTEVFGNSPLIQPTSDMDANLTVSAGLLSQSGKNGQTGNLGVVLKWDKNLNSTSPVTFTPDLPSLTSVADWATAMGSTNSILAALKKAGSDDFGFKVTGTATTDYTGPIAFIPYWEKAERQPQLLPSH
jgi:hypothetical protein